MDEPMKYYCEYCGEELPVNAIYDNGVGYCDEDCQTWAESNDPYAWMDGSDWAASNPLDKEADNAPTPTSDNDDL